ncbi:MAG: glycosyltransferase family 2 protein [Myxococcales bacterium]|nr:glycosyltransferase family 2 protein [Myxococcales bacterium]
MHRPTVTVFIPVYNRGRYLAQAVDSMLAQTYRDFEILIIDDGSEDDSLEIARSYRDPRVRVEANSKNIGNTPTRNRGIDLSRGRYIATLDSDDFAMPERLAKQVAYLEAHKDCVAVGSWIRKQDDMTGTSRLKRHPLTSREMKAWFPWNNSLSQTSIMVRADTLKLLRYDESYEQCQDYDLHIRLSREHDIANLPEALTVKRLHSEQTTRKVKIGSETKLRVIRKLLGELDIEPTDNELKLHYILTRPELRRGAVDASSLDAVAIWLRRLLGANARMQSLPEPEFSRVVASVWLVACKSAAVAKPWRVPSMLATRPFSSHILSAVGQRAANYLGRA